MIGLPTSGLNLCFDGCLTVVHANDICSWLFGLSEPELNINNSKHMGFNYKTCNFCFLVCQENT